MDGHRRDLPTSSHRMVRRTSCSAPFFWIPCIIYLSLDCIAPTFSHRHKIQPIPAPATRADIIQCLRVVVGNQAVSMIVHAVLLGANHLAGKPSNYRITAALPSALELLRDVALSVLVREVAFYYAHRTLHRPLFYARVHKTHHRFTAPFALAAQYATVPEHIFANVLPIALPGMLFRSHILSYWAFVASQLVDTATVHSGLRFLRALRGDARPASRILQRQLRSIWAVRLAARD